MVSHSSDRALVLGASMTGLLTARALSDLYGEVLLVDRDSTDSDGASRKGVPQGRHMHILLPRGLEALEELFEGLTSQLTGAGAPAWDMLDDARVHLGGHRLRQAPTGMVTVSASRPFLEHAVRERVRSLPGVTLVDRCDVAGLMHTPDNKRVAGARVVHRDENSTEEALEADLVVDATGRNSRLGAWLEPLGVAPPASERVEIGLGYVTRRFAIPADVLGGDRAVLVGPTPGSTRGGALALLQDGSWMLTLFGVLGDHPSTDPEAFREFARSLPIADIHDVIADAQAVDDPVPFKYPASVRRRYDQMKGFPDGLVVVGDSASSVNPIYGQGMTVAALQALALRQHLSQGAVRSRKLRRELARPATVAWEMVAGADLAFPGAKGKRTRRMQLANSYISRLHAGAAKDGQLGVCFARVLAMVDPPTALLRPSVVRRVLR